MRSMVNRAVYVGEIMIDGRIDSRFWLSCCSRVDEDSDSSVVSEQNIDSRKSEALFLRSSSPPAAQKQLSRDPAEIVEAPGPFLFLRERPYKRVTEYEEIAQKGRAWVPKKNSPKGRAFQEVLEKADEVGRGSYRSSDSMWAMVGSEGGKMDLKKNDSGGRGHLVR